MAQTIGNPGTWLANVIGRTGRHVAASTSRLGSEDVAPPQVQTLSMQDIRGALRDGWADFQASRSDVMFLVLLYPVMGLVLMGIGLQMSLVPLLFPLVAGFALLGPVAAVGVYEISRRREAGEDAGMLSALKVVERPSFSAILVLGLYLAMLFLAWMAVAMTLYSVTMGPGAPASIGAFLSQVLGTGAGWTMIVLGCGIGFVFALVVLAVSVVAFPLLLDRKTGLPVAVETSVRVTRQNPQVILAWGALVAGLLVLGSLPFLLGLVLVLPWLGHATWHLYRRAVK
ncbi:DUF2189 domain-containing protein [Pseudoponticoccus marisrubri]|uniref:Cytochrome C oxidase subunit I n=1 Tax=Pseudoponticoccus marisrubri TaxID=1685382 RepID=A0A0W7WFI6_9RHOB|nr:DUF2189 domain-containing protein [Pseudoponticoccus marisrubri]KUF09230.1 cytochrome C oxidase subunit I [Pseudoponticoccus marisrubri]